jgi:hypothetical protein
MHMAKAPCNECRSRLKCIEATESSIIQQALARRNEPANLLDIRQRGRRESASSLVPRRGTQPPAQKRHCLLHVLLAHHGWQQASADRRRRSAFQLRNSPHLKMRTTLCVQTRTNQVGGVGLVIAGELKGNLLCPWGFTTLRTGACKCGPGAGHGAGHGASVKP